MVKTAQEKAAAKAEKEPSKTPTVAAVYSKSNQVIREYTREVHGDEFEALAKQFADQHVGSRIEVL